MVLLCYYYYYYYFVINELPNLSQYHRTQAFESSLVAEKDKKAKLALVRHFLQSIIGVG